MRRAAPPSTPACSRRPSTPGFFSSRTKPYLWNTYQDRSVQSAAASDCVIYGTELVVVKASVFRGGRVTLLPVFSAPPTDRPHDGGKQYRRCLWNHQGHAEARPPPTRALSAA